MTFVVEKGGVYGDYGLPDDQVFGFTDPGNMTSDLDDVPRKDESLGEFDRDPDG